MKSNLCNFRRYENAIFFTKWNLKLAYPGLYELVSVKHFISFFCKNFLLKWYHIKEKIGPFFPSFSLSAVYQMWLFDRLGFQKKSEKNCVVFCDNRKIVMGSLGFKNPINRLCTDEGTLWIDAKSFGAAVAPF